ncbi:Cytochrome c551 peroxidase [hydrothermal vent metagenome]|uniref:Cytochrome c551 peroxidase n=1 Tax=hydrothermal vent metagenome TaxID=652676 RepID=A0A1W1BKZ2_9ZZZZ
MRRRVAILSVTVFMLIGCGSSGSDNSERVADNGGETKFETKEKLGESLFFDKNLSLTKSTSCATCHDPKHGFADARHTVAGNNNPVNGALSVGDDGVSLGGRNAPTAAYAKFSPAFDPAEIKGGQFHDGRAATLKDQAMGPPLDGAEMMMPDKKSVVDRIKDNPKYVASFKALYGEDIFKDIDASFEAMGEAIGKFEKTDEFAPFDSKYDKYVDCINTGKEASTCLTEGKWSDSEKLGLELYFDKDKTNCVECHQLKDSSGVAGETFTKYKYHNIGVPKNLVALKARAELGLADANATDHGVLGTVPTATNKDGAVKVPTLRNVAITSPYMSNGIFQKLSTVLRFYNHMGDGGTGAREPLNPETNQPWGEPDVDGASISKEKLTMPELDDTQIEALEAFLNTLTDERYEHLLKK